MVANEAWNMYNFRRGLIRDWLQRGHRVSVLVPEDRCSEELRRLGCDVYPLPVDAQGLNPLTDALLMWRLHRFFRKLKPDLIFSYTIKPNVYAPLAARVAGIPSIAVTTGLGYTFINRSLLAQLVARLYQFSFLFPKAVWFLNADDRSAFVQRGLVPESKTFVLHGEGVDTAHFAPRPDALPRDGKFRFLLIARMLWDKGVGDFVQAARQIRERHPDTVFQLLGPSGAGNPSAIERAQIAEWEAEGLIEYFGEQSDVRDYVAQADCVVLPSYREGVPRALMEAAAMEKPIVTNDVAGCRVVVDEGVNGYLCRARDPRDLADKMQRVLVLPEEERRRLGRNGRLKTLAEFDEQTVFQAYARAIDNDVGLKVVPHVPA